MTSTALINQLVTDRKTLATLKSEMEAKQKEFDAQNADLVKRLKEASLSVSVTESAIREVAIAEFDATGNKKPFAGIGVRVSKSLSYPEDAAFKWAEVNAPLLIERSLSKKAFAGLMATLEGSDKLPEFITVTDVKTATIATDLQPIIEENEKETAA